MKYLIFAATTALMASTAQVIPALNPEALPVGTSNLQAQVLINTMFSERSPGFNDLYMIETPDKGRQIVIYCNPSYCYKLRGQTLTA
ncbi:MAG: hypothetical protein VW258_04460 [Thalassolituus sp.]